MRNQLARFPNICVGIVLVGSFFYRGHRLSSISATTTLSKVGDLISLIRSNSSPLSDTAGPRCQSYHKSGVKPSLPGLITLRNWALRISPSKVALGHSYHTRESVLGNFSTLRGRQLVLPPCMRSVYLPICPDAASQATCHVFP